MKEARMPSTFTITDPATYEGTPYEVAYRALTQVQGLALIASHALSQSETMVRNAELSRNLYYTPDDARAEEWDASIQKRKLDSAAADLDRIAKELSVLAKAAAFDPRSV
jgi:hypothetical protein